MQRQLGLRVLRSQVELPAGRLVAQIAVARLLIQFELPASSRSLRQNQRHHDTKSRNYEILMIRAARRCLAKVPKGSATINNITRKLQQYDWSFQPCAMREDGYVTRSTGKQEAADACLRLTVDGNPLSAQIGGNDVLKLLVRSDAQGVGVWVGATSRAVSVGGGGENTGWTGSWRLPRCGSVDARYSTPSPSHTVAFERAAAGISPCRYDEGRHISVRARRGVMILVQWRVASLDATDGSSLHDQVTSFPMCRGRNGTRGDEITVCAKWITHCSPAVAIRSMTVGYAYGAMPVLPLKPRWPERRRSRGHRVAGGGAHRRGACLRSISAPDASTSEAKLIT
nr:hypothetical protein CFP56_75885 [Quercus suber]